MKQPVSYSQKIFKNNLYNCYVIPADDGTPLAVKQIGNKTKYPLLLGNGVGVPWFGFHHLCNQLKDDFDIYLWDYRGSSESFPVGKPDFSIKNQAKDALKIMTSFGFVNFAYLGWSMGVPVGIEINRQAPGKISVLAALFGSPGHPYRESLGKTGNWSLLQAVKYGLNHLGTASLLKFVLKSKPALIQKLFVKMGFISKDVDPELFAEVFLAVVKNNTTYYGQSLLALGKYNGWPYLEQLDFPVLVAGGGKDWVSPARTMKKMAESIKNSDYNFIEEGCHFSLMQLDEDIYSPVKYFLSSKINQINPPETENIR
ncbi:MAG: alpha/beta fold hydrolase [Deltaproteobacteria bacterium]|jgi:pimeloyl-ACP methyl ester carboxylesterase|nr:alpha/beta fold hydrolase [Deltaproteobacteria bacterium]